MKIYYFLYLIISFFFISNKLFAQNPYADIQQYPKETIAKNKVYKITAWEYVQEETIEQVLDTTVIDPFKQSVEIFDTLGRLVSKENFWPYSDEEPLKRIFQYDSLDNISSYEEYIGKELVSKEIFTYDSVNNLKTWSAEKIKKRQKYFQEIINYDSLNNPTQITVQLGKKIVANQYIDYVYNIYKKPILEICRDDKQHLVDSVFYKYPKESDTLYIKSIYEGKDKKLVRIQSFINRLDGTELYRNEEYVDNKFIGVTYHFFEKDKGLVKERSIHHYPQLNFTKNYIFNEFNLIHQKIVLKNKQNPVSIIKYKILRFGEVELEEEEVKKQFHEEVKKKRQKLEKQKQEIKEQKKNKEEDSEKQDNKNKKKKKKRKKKKKNKK